MESTLMTDEWKQISGSNKRWDIKRRNEGRFVKKMKYGNKWKHKEKDEQTKKNLTFRTLLLNNQTNSIPFLKIFRYHWFFFCNFDNLPF